MLCNSPLNCSLCFRCWEVGVKKFWGLSIRTQTRHSSYRCPLLCLFFFSPVCPFFFSLWSCVGRKGLGPVLQTTEASLRPHSPFFPSSSNPTHSAPIKESLGSGNKLGFQGGREREREGGGGWGDHKQWQSFSSAGGEKEITSKKQFSLILCLFLW